MDPATLALAVIGGIIQIIKAIAEPAFYVLGCLAFLRYLKRG